MIKLNKRKAQQFKYLLADFLSAELVWICFLIFRWMAYEGILFSINTILIPAFSFYKPLFLYPLFCCIIYYLSGFYMRPFGKSRQWEFLTTFFSAIAISLGAFFVIIIDDHVPNILNYYSSLCVLFCLQFVLSLLGRIIVSSVTGSYKHQTKTYTLKGKQIRNILQGGTIELPSGTETVVIQMPNDSSEQDLFKVISHVYPMSVEILFPARLYDMLVGSAQLKDFNTQPMVCITDLPMSDSAMCIKRAFDIMAATILGIILSPILLLIALAVKLSDKGPVLYRQERIGHYGIPFKIIKFRTMRTDAETDTPSLTIDDDPRVTRLGKWLRKYRLDELPQLWNVICGEMSIVGPRPEREFFINQIVQEAPYYCLIYKVRPGLTSWGPIRVGYTDTIEKMIQRLNYDIVYVENMSLVLDIKIMLKTFRVIVDGKGK